MWLVGCITVSTSVRVCVCVCVCLCVCVCVCMCGLPHLLAPVLMPALSQHTHLPATALLCSTIHHSKSSPPHSLTNEPREGQRQSSEANMSLPKSSPFCLFFVFFMAAPATYGSSQPRVQIGAAAMATATQDPSHICKLHHSSQQCWILNPQSKARDRTLLLMVTSWVLLITLSHNGNSKSRIFKTKALADRLVKDHQSKRQPRHTRKGRFLSEIRKIKYHQDIRVGMGRSLTSSASS